MIKKQLILDKFNYYKTHLMIINPLLPINLTPKEIELLTHFMVLNGSIAHDRFGTTGRKLVKERMKLSSASMSNYMKGLRDKGFINDNEIISILFPDTQKQEYYFKLTKKGEENE